MDLIQLKIVTEYEGQLLVRKWKDEGQQIVFTNGCFDILHVGHIDSFERAKHLGTKLVVGVNSDASVRRLKGPGRPVNDENARLRMLAALDFVDAVIKFNEDTPERIIKMLLPDVLVKGKDYKKSNVVGADIVIENGGRVETLELLEGYSTSGIIEKIRRLN